MARYFRTASHLIDEHARRRQGTTHSSALLTVVRPRTEGLGKFTIRSDPHLPHPQPTSSEIGIRSQPTVLNMRSHSSVNDDSNMRLLYDIK